MTAHPRVVVDLLSRSPGRPTGIFPPAAQYLQRNSSIKEHMVHVYVTFSYVLCTFNCSGPFRIYLHISACGSVYSTGLSSWKCNRPGLLLRNNSRIENKDWSILTKNKGVSNKKGTSWAVLDPRRTCGGSRAALRLAWEPRRCAEVQRGSSLEQHVCQERDSSVLSRAGILAAFEEFCEIEWGESYEIQCEEFFQSIVNVRVLSRNLLRRRR